MMFRSCVGRWRLLVVFVLSLVPAAVHADTVTLAWDPSTGATGYTVKWGTTQGSYPNSADAGNNTTFDIQGLTPGATYWAVVRAYDATQVSALSTPLQFTVPMPPVPCTYSISPATANVGAGASSGAITVTTQAGCAWSATSSSPFLAFQNGAGRVGPGSVSFSITANPATSSRIGTGMVAGQGFAITQAGQACTFAISPAGASVGAGAGSGTINVTTQAGCAWNAASGSSFLTFANGAGRTGPGTVDFSVTANPNTSPRTGTATVAGQAFSVSQAAQACTYAISPATANTGAGASGGTITVTTQSGCGWSATSASPFLTFQNGTGRSGPGSVSFSAAANTTTSSRVGSATVAGQPFSLTQAGQACTYSISPASTSVNASGASATINVTTQAGCAWSATSASGFLTFANGSGRTGPGTVDFSVASNTATTARTGTATVAGQSFSVSQAGVSQACTFSITPVSAAAPAAGTTGTITVTTQADCTWSASSVNPFLTFPDGADRTGPGTVTFEVAANTSGFRTGSANVAGRLFTVSQMGGSCTYSITPANVTTSAAGSSGTVTVNTQSGCSWSASSWTSFLAFQDGVGRSGPGTVSYTVAENTSAGSRNAVGAIAGVTFMISQGGEASTAPGQAAPSPWGTDFDGDGKNDLLIHDPVVGTLEAWFLDNATIKGTQTFTDLVEPNWVVAGRGDFNADGKPDLVMQHKNDGWVSIWFMDGTTRIEADPTSIAQIEPHWQVVGIGDFNGDGKPDIAWQHSDDGKLAVWEMDGVTVTATSAITPDSVPDLNWKAVGVGDFNNDGKSDLVWRHMGTGDVGVWLMNGLSRIIHSPLSPFSVPDQRWQISAVIDVNGDGKSDLIWTHSDGTIMIWHMNGTVRTTYPIIPAPLPAGWLLGPR